MKLIETGDVLALAAAYDRRTIGEADVLAWHAALVDVDPDDAKAAVVAHYRESTDWLMPAHVRRHAENMRRERLRTEREAREAAEAQRLTVRGRDRKPEVVQLIRQLHDRLPDGDIAKLKPRQVFWQRQRRLHNPLASREPNPHFRALPPPEGLPVPDESEAS